MSLVDSLLAILFPPRDGEAQVLETSRTLLEQFLEPTVHTLGGASVITLLPYREPRIRACIREAKFHTNTRAHRLLGSVLGEFLETFAHDRIAFTEHTQPSFTLVPIPLSKKRRRARGHNQTESIARSAFRQLSTSIALDTRILKRNRDTAAQTSLSKEARIANLADAFVTTSEPNPAHTYIVFDDVATTGATLRAAHTALAEAGARDILLLSLAH